MANLFRSVKATKVPRNKFNLSHEVKLTTEFGRLTPFFLREVVPGDKYRLSVDILCRMAPLYAPVMHRVNLYVHYFFVPNRLLQKQWPAFISGGIDGNGTVNAGGLSDETVTATKMYVELDDLYNICMNHPTAPYDPFSLHSLMDYFGFPVHHDNNDIDISSSSKRVDLLPFQAYNLIYNEFYRDENFQAEVNIFNDYDLRNGNNLLNALASTGIYTDADLASLMVDLFKPKQRNWEKDYFTSALPFPQRGEDTTIGQYDARIYPYPSDAHKKFEVDSRNEVDIDAASIANMLELNQSNNVSVNELRRAMAVQRFKEKLARYGSRYTEFLRGLFGVKPKDATLQRPQYLGGGRMPIVFGEVLQTSETTSSSALGEYAGRGIGANSSKQVTKYCDEHGLILGIMSIMPKPDYFQGWPRMFNRWNKFDYYLPDFAHIGEQEINQEELVFSNNSNDINLFGYQSRYAEYKYMPNRVAGEFRESMLDWHLARQFQHNQYNMLNDKFLRVDNEEMDRIFNFRATGYDHIWLQCYNNVNALLPMPKFGTPH